MPKDYVYKLWLAHGITTVRDPGSTEGIDTIVAHARLSAENKIAAPTIIPYAVAAANTPDEAHALVRRLKQQGALGLKVFINRPDVWEAIADEAKRQGLPIATDMKLQELDALDAARLGVRSIEHWYGIPDAATPGPQNFPDSYNYDNELDRFRWAGDIWRQADSTRLSAVLDTMLAHGMTWDPTFAIYEANRDLQRARTQPWFRDYALPQVMQNFEPDATRHGSYHFDWTTVVEPAARFENLVASHLLKWAHYQLDTQGRAVELRYFRDVDGREVDFVLTDHGKPIAFVECKWDDAEVSPSLRYVQQRFTGVPAWQISAVGKKDFETADGIRVAPAVKLLSQLV